MFLYSVPFTALLVQLVQLRCTVLLQYSSIGVRMFLYSVCTILHCYNVHCTVTIFLYRCYNDPPGISCIHDHPQDDEEDDEDGEDRERGDFERRKLKVSVCGQQHLILEYSLFHVFWLLHSNENGRVWSLQFQLRSQVVPCICSFTQSSWFVTRLYTPGWPWVVTSRYIL